MVSPVIESENLRLEILNKWEQWRNSRAFCSNEKSVSSVEEFSKVIISFGKQGNDNGKWLFRGESQLFDVPFTPSIIRDKVQLSNNKFPKKHITDEEIFEVEKCQSETKSGEIKDRYLKAFLPLMHKNDVNWLPLARHFGYKTRLLDVTVNPLVALYFACNTLHKGVILKNDDAFVYAFQSGSFRPINSKNSEQINSSDYPPIPINYLDLYDVDQQFGNVFDELPYMFEPMIPQERLQAQSGRLLFWKALKPVLHNSHFIPIRICASEKAFILNELSAFGITKNTLFPNE